MLGTCRLQNQDEYMCFLFLFLFKKQRFCNFGGFVCSKLLRIIFLMQVIYVYFFRTLYVHFVFTYLLEHSIASPKKIACHQRRFFFDRYRKLLCIKSQCQLLAEGKGKLYITEENRKADCKISPFLNAKLCKKERSEEPYLLWSIF